MAEMTIETTLTDNFDDRYSIEYLTAPKLNRDGRWVCLANYYGMLCMVEVTLRARTDQEKGK